MRPTLATVAAEWKCYLWPEPAITYILAFASLISPFLSNRSILFNLVLHLKDIAYCNTVVLDKIIHNQQKTIQRQINALSLLTGNIPNHLVAAYFNGIC